jgi:hypothetical protein
VAVPGEFLWPFPGTSRGRPRGIFMTACGEFLMAIDKRADALASIFETFP